MNADRRQFLAAGAAALTAAACTRAADPTPHTPNHIGVSTYSFWQFKNEDLRDLEKCIDLAGEMGFDAVEILHRQMKDETPGYLHRISHDLTVTGGELSSRKQQVRGRDRNDRACQ